MLFELSNRRALSEFILVAILKFIERKERIEDMIFGSFHQGKAVSNRKKATKNIKKALLKEGFNNTNKKLRCRF
jgi:hypothetical protein